MNVAFVGAGKASLKLIELYQTNQLVNIVGVVDPNTWAPGVKLARKLKIPVFSNLKVLLNSNQVNMIVEVTGNTKVLTEIYKLIDGNIDIITAGAALLVDTILKQQTQKKNEEISLDILDLSEKLKGTIDKINQTSFKIDSVMREFELLALNASIEAARSGESGAGFSVVATRMKAVAQNVQQSVSSISESSNEGTNLLKNISVIQKKFASSS